MALAEDSEEYAETARRFRATLEELRDQISIVQKGSVARSCAAGTAAERVLFHGTTAASSREICLHGFNRSFCGKNATLYGLGVYFFAARAAVSARDRYSPPGAGGAKFVFVAKVLTGDVVDDPRRPDVFVIFNDTQAYPQYLVTCRSRHGGPL
ncbi:hypothetical protein DUI87_00183 [Hirundo rustica rustica]|uniref:Poly [ADP-ribose] polymerase n=1 Tax=Hirundo rustica rustica TaxID=333673 RepID=A0A3M0LB23_HIRRU|nr:hypothetical protein DUI87_00183 [Hirundo rustica rustica]